MSEGGRPRGRYKTTNWVDYNAALKARGSLTVWLDTEMQWHAPATSKRGRQPTFSDAAIQFCLSIRCLFGLALYQSLGMVESLLSLAGLVWKVPDFSTVCRRQKRLSVKLPYSVKVPDPEAGAGIRSCAVCEALAALTKSPLRRGFCCQAHLGFRELLRRPVFGASLTTGVTGSQMRE